PAHRTTLPCRLDPAPWRRSIASLGRGRRPSIRAEELFASTSGVAPLTAEEGEGSQPADPRQQQDEQRVARRVEPFPSRPPDATRRDPLLLAGGIALPKDLHPAVADCRDRRRIIRLGAAPLDLDARTDGQR